MDRRHWGWLLSVGLLCLVLSQFGCARSQRATMTRLWDNPWSETEPSAASPTVTAMKPAAIDDGQSLAADSELADNSAISPESAADSGLGPIAFPATQEGLPELDDLEPAANAQTESRLAELRHALLADVESEPPESTLNRQPLRMRVDGLIRRANQLLTAGRLPEARRNAQLAEELSKTAQIEFPPTEERPSDLISQIDVALAAQQPTENTELAAQVLTGADDPNSAITPKAIANTASRLQDWQLPLVETGDPEIRGSTLVGSSLPVVADIDDQLQSDPRAARLRAEMSRPTSLEPWKTVTSSQGPALTPLDDVEPLPPLRRADRLGKPDSSASAAESHRLPFSAKAELGPLALACVALLAAWSLVLGLRELVRRWRFHGISRRSRVRT